MDPLKPTAYVLRFEKNWEIKDAAESASGEALESPGGKRQGSAIGPVVEAGKPLRIVYNRPETERTRPPNPEEELLDELVGEASGDRQETVPYKRVDLHYRGAHEQLREQPPVAMQPTGDGAKFEATIKVPETFKGILQLWFWRHQQGGGSLPDSKYGENYPVTVLPPVSGELSFTAIGTERVTGRIKPGTSMRISCDPERYVRAGGPAPAKIYAEVSFDGYHTVEVPILASGRTWAPIVAVPDHAQRGTVRFRALSASGEVLRDPVQERYPFTVAVF
jgi:hypothetical protein